jgi:diguanylate cyclase (GGDEF)-like protein
MSEVIQEQPPVSVKEILNHYLVGDLSRSHEQAMIRMQRLGLSDEQIRETAKALKSDRQQIADLKMDELTGLPKDNACRAIIEKAIGEGERIAVGFNDFVSLHGFNRMIGHERTNNEIFKPIAAAYNELMIDYHRQGRKVFIGRYGGDEFLIIIIGEDKETAEGIFSEIKKAERRLKKPEGAVVKPFFSHGFAYSGDAENPKASLLIEEADQKCLNDKQRLKEKIRRKAQESPGGRMAQLLDFARRD